MCSEESLAAKLSAVLPHLDERQRRLVMGAEARALGHGGIKTVARAAGVSAVGTVNLRSCGRSANHISLIGHTRPGESRRRTGEKRPRIAQVDNARQLAVTGQAAGGAVERVPRGLAAKLEIVQGA
jgi:hypothetical protein